MRRLVAATTSLVLSVVAWTIARQTPALSRGQIIDAVACAGDPSETYALYLPSTYTPDRAWPLLMGFHPGARGRAIVETYQAAAERYGYIVAGSNNSRNGPWAVSAAAVQAMTIDIGTRFTVDPRRFYLTGLSGGSRVALQVALGTNKIAGVIASSAGYPDNRPRSSVPFAVFATTGTEDFNYIEMRMLSRALTSPHRLAIFDGGHMLPPPDVARAAVEWLELQAMTSGRRPVDNALVDAWLAARRLEASASTDAIRARRLRDIDDDFRGLRDTAADASAATSLEQSKAVRAVVARERSADDFEAKTLDEILSLEAGLRSLDSRLQSLAGLRSRLAGLATTAGASADSPDRQQARRMLRAITTGATERVSDSEYLRLLQDYRGRS